ncbi:MAG: fused MFS/spermidine synthase [Terriglobia bacterium]|jgi:hypothetical protein
MLDSFLIQTFGFFRRPMSEALTRSNLFARFTFSQGEGSCGLTPEPESFPDLADPGGRSSQTISVAAFSVTMFLSAALLFLVEPMFAKMALPLLGGTAAVWTTCLVFFQATLLAGYAYAHASAKLLGRRGQVAVHLAVLLAALALLPVHVPGGWTPPLQPNPVGWLLRLLLVAVGLPFFALSATTPILQKWFAHSGHPSSGDPYFLYAASNSGSLLGLLSYPFVLEPLLRLSDQSRLWTWGYGLFLLLVTGCILLVWRSPHEASVLASTPRPDARLEEVAARHAENPTPRRRLRWVALAFVPSSLMLGVTTALTTDIPAIPLFWVLPLALYLLSFVLVFARKPLLSHFWLSRRLPLLILAAAIPIVLKGVLPLMALLPIDLLALFAVAMVCHGEVARSRPTTQHLTEFYLWISVGGVLGGAFNALLAPVIFSTVVELPIALVLAAILCPPIYEVEDTPRARRLDYLLPAALGLAVVVATLELQAKGLAPGRLFNLIIFAPAAICCLRFGTRPRRFGLGVAALILASQVYAGPFGHILHSERSFFGVYRVGDDVEKNDRVLFHGGTAHGVQSLDPSRACEPLAYYTRSGPIGQVFEAFQESPVENEVAVIGLGAGVMACYHQPQQRFTFYEIDPTVLHIAQNRRYFTYLSDCGPPLRVVLGDARLSLRDAPAHSYGMMVLDAFSGDSIPTHLLTREALALYLTKLAPNGILAFHISNRYLDLHGVLGDLAHDAGLSCLMNDDAHVSEDEMREGKFASSWVVMARNSNDLEALRSDPGWRALPAGPGSRVWTDDFSNIVSILRLI